MDLSPAALRARQEKLDRVSDQIDNVVLIDLLRGTADLLEEIANEKDKVIIQLSAARGMRLVAGRFANPSGAGDMARACADFDIASSNVPTPLSESKKEAPEFISCEELLDGMRMLCILQRAGVFDRLLKQGT